MLIIKIQKGETAAFDTLYNRYRVRIAVYLKRFLFYREAIEDVSQDVFLKVYQNLKNFDVERQFSSWIYRIAHNEACNWLRKNGGERQMFSLEDQEDRDADQMPAMECQNPLPNEEFLKKEQSTEVKMALDKIKVEYKRVIELYYMQGLSYREISLTIEKPENTVGTLICRAKKALEKELELTSA